LPHQSRQGKILHEPTKQGTGTPTDLVNSIKTSSSVNIGPQSSNFTINPVSIVDLGMATHTSQAFGDGNPHFTSIWGWQPTLHKHLEMATHTSQAFGDNNPCFTEQLHERHQNLRMATHTPQTLGNDNPQFTTVDLRKAIHTPQTSSPQMSTRGWQPTLTNISL
jgi:hypothetical protein